MRGPESKHADPTDRWVQACAQTEGFWSAAPMWSSGVARRVVDGQMLLWGEQGLVQLSAAATAVVVHVDGQATLGELAEDLAAAAGLPEREAQSILAGTACELDAWGLLHGVPVIDPTEIVDPAEAANDRDPAVASTEPARAVERLEVVDGQRVTTEYLPDGRRLVTTELVLSTDAADAASRSIAAAALGGERSMAELVPAGSCLGEKLRAGEDAPLLSFRCVDGQVRSVRCDDELVAAELQRRAGDRLLTTSERGPVEAFVVTPWEGEGPVRIYDGQGRRRGRPRTPGDAVDVVDQLLGECVDPEGPGTSADLPLRAALVVQVSDSTATPDPVGVLVPRAVVELPRVARRLARAGWTVTWAHARSRSDGHVAAPSGLGWVTPATKHVTLPRRPEDIAPTGAVALSLATTPGCLDTETALDRLVEMSARAASAAPVMTDPRTVGASAGQPD